MSKGWIIIALCVSSFCFSEARSLTAKFLNVTVYGIERKTRNGRDVESFMGIAYAKPPIGDLRFRDPIPKVYRARTLLADEPPMRCLQSIARFVGNGNSTRDLKGDEDCLYLNIHRPASTGNQLLPVMVYFQAADLLPGPEDILNIGPDFLLDRDIVLVIVSYRLGVFGFLSTGDEAAPGNFGLKDQKVALEWVQSNIVGFGGDPNRVTLFGQGEAAKLIHIHALVNHTEGLFHQYILQSGTALAPWAVRDSKTSTEWTLNLAKLNRCPTDSSSVIVDCLRLMDSRQLLELSYKPFSSMDIGLAKMWAPTKEPISPRAFLTDCPDDLIARGKQRDLPFIAGLTRYENTYQLIANRNDENDIVDNEYDEFRERKKLAEDDLFKMTLGSSDLGERVYQFYYKVKFDEPEPSSTKSDFQYTIYTVFEETEQFLNDLTYYYPETRMLEERRQNSKTPFYFYRFEFARILSVSTWLQDVHGPIEAAHGDDLLYLFHHDTSRFPSNGPWSDTLQNKMIDNMVELWTSFATLGVPRSDEIPNWTPYDSEGHYLRIGFDNQPMFAMRSKFLLERMSYMANITPELCD